MTLRSGLAIVAAIVIALAPSLARADEIDDRVRDQFLATSTELCPDAGAAQAQMFEVGYRDRYAEPKTPEEFIRLYQFVCLQGAYNTLHVFFTYSAFAGIQPVFFAVPDLQVNCANGGPPGDECRVTGVEVRGMNAVGELVGAVFDPATKTITSHACARGVCDASDIGTWTFENGRFVLETYDVDATYDAQINPVRVVDYTGV